MTQHCRANPCCGDVPCSGIPLPQDKSGFARLNADKEQVKAMGSRFDELAERSKREQSIGLLHGVTPTVGICWTHSEMRLTFSRMISEEERVLLGRLMTIAIKGYHDAKAAKAEPTLMTQLNEATDKNLKHALKVAHMSDLSVNASVSETRTAIRDDQCAYCRKPMLGGYFCETQDCPARGLDQYPEMLKPARQRAAAGTVAEPSQPVAGEPVSTHKYEQSGPVNPAIPPEATPEATPEAQRLPLYRPR